MEPQLELGHEAGPTDKVRALTPENACSEAVAAKGLPTAALSQSVILLFAAACGLSVANIYYAQPLLDAMAHDFSINPASVGIVVTVTQIGYALGLLLIVPLGDLLDRRMLIVGQAVLSAMALVVVGFAPTGTVLLAGMVAVGLLAVVVQVLVAFAATWPHQPSAGGSSARSRVGWCSAFCWPASWPACWPISAAGVRFISPRRF